MASRRGWLLDAYAHPADGVVLWLLDDDGERRRLRHAFPASFYAHGPNQQLRELWAFLRSDREPLELGRARRRDLFAGELDVLEARVPHAPRQPSVYYRAKERFPDLAFYDADVSLPVRYGAMTGVFPLARVEALTDEENNLAHIRPLDGRWDTDPAMPLLRVMTVEPDAMPSHREPRLLTVRMGRTIRRLSLGNPRATLERLGRMLDSYDPDLLFAAWGDRWLFPKLFELAEQYGVPFNPNRDKSLPPDRRKENSYYTYGQVVYRAEQTFLYGRWHIDPKNAMMYGEYDLRGVLEQARVSGLPVQEVARKSPGSGITAMQMRTAMQNGILVPHLKQEPERFKSLEDLITADWGGMVYQPTIGLHEHVAAIDFFSMYPSIMEHFNISPETVGTPGENPLFVPMSGMPVNQDEPGLIPEVVRPILEKRWKIKRRLLALDRRDVEYRQLKAQSDALKWLLVVSFGYLGYKNARWGKIESHEAVTALSRELLLQAKETAEAHGFRVLHMYVDGLYIQKEDARRAQDFEAVVRAI
ncbi:MAG: hypothetical protein OEV06_10625, partial [Anaerolineae bacterium]|nr:hypothetical protein [Anaerolineae bacterium]